MTPTPAADGVDDATRSRRRSALRPNTRYRLVVDGVRDVDGVAVARPTLVGPDGRGRRASSGSARETTRRDVARDAAISVRFTQPMDEATTKAAFTVTAGGKPVAGKVTFAEDDTVLVFDPAKALPYGAKVVMTVGADGTQPRRRRRSARGRRRLVQDRRRSRRGHGQRRRRRRAAASAAAAAAARSAAAAGARSRRTTSG